MLRWHGTKGDGRGGTESLELHQELIWNKQGIPTSQKRQKGHKIKENDIRDIVREPKANNEVKTHYRLSKGFILRKSQVKNKKEVLS